MELREPTLVEAQRRMWAFLSLTTFNNYTRRSWCSDGEFGVDVDKVCWYPTFKQNPPEYILSTMSLSDRERWGR